MGGSKPQTTTTVANNAPWSEAQPALKTGLADAQNLYKSGVGSQAYTGSTVIPFAQQTTAGMNSIQNTANQNMNGMGLSGQYQNTINSGGFNAPQQTAVNNLTQTATNPFDITADPAYMRMRGAVADDVQNRVNENASAYGRYGSGMHTNAMTKTLGDTLAGMDTQQLDRMQGRQDAATQNLFNAGQQGFGNLGQAYEGMKAPAQDQMGIGSMYEDLAGRLKNDELRIFQEQQQQPWNQLGRLNAIASGAGTMGGTSSSTAQMPGQNKFATGLGYATGIGSLLGSFGGF
jgi:hypothetical protein